ncbi:MAG: SAM-dependent methyltransferase, partial [Acidobacteriota bacterium]
KDKLEIPVPPKYARGDFKKASIWRLRGKLDVPKERFVLYPGAERNADPSPVLGWAGWDHLQRAQALAAAYVEARDQEAWSATRLAVLLDGLDELMPWLLQWHDEHDPSLGMGLGRYFQGFVAEERRRLADWSDEDSQAGDDVQSDLFH